MRLIDEVCDYTNNFLNDVTATEIFIAVIITAIAIWAYVSWKQPNDTGV